MIVMLNNNRMDIVIGETVTVLEALDLIELSLYRKLELPITVAVNKKPVIAQATAANLTLPTAASASNTKPPKNLPQETPAVKNNASSISESEINTFITEWAEAWSSKNINGYLAKYSPNFKTPNGESFADWQDSRKNRIVDEK